MHRTRVLFAAVAALTLFGSAARFSNARGQSAAPASAGVASAQELALGKKLFVAKCAKCHNEAGDKPVGGGLPLSKRKLTDEKLTNAVRGRLGSASEEAKRAVLLYIRSFQEH
jgi:mono/diheme cytochrome c family protein